MNIAKGFHSSRRYRNRLPTLIMVGINLILIMVLCVALLAQPADVSMLSWPQNPAGDRVESFNSEIRVHEDGRLTVTEVIVLYSATEISNRGIRRYLPKRYDTFSKDAPDVIYTPTDIRRGYYGEPAASFGYKRVNDGPFDKFYLGEEKIMLAPGLYTYIFQYEVDRAVQRLDEYDRLEFDVTGDYWNIPIRSAVVRVVLPHGLSRDTVAFNAETYKLAFEEGVVRDQVLTRTENHEWTAYEMQPAIEFAMTSALVPHEGLKIAVISKKGRLRDLE